MRTPRPQLPLAALLAFAAACADPSTITSGSERALVPVDAASLNIIPCPPTIPSGYALVFCFDFDFIPGVLHGFLLQQSTTPATLSHQYLLLAPTNFQYFVPGTPVDHSISSYTFQPEFNGVVWNDVVRFALANTAPPQRITIAVVRSAPISVVNGPYTGTEGASVTMSGAGSSSPTGAPLTYDWDFGDGSPHGAGINPTHAYADNGVYSVRLTVSDGAGSTTSQTTATISNVNPTAVFTAPTAFVLAGSTFQLSLASPTDPSSTDLAAGFTYTFNCGLGLGAPSSVASQICTAPAVVGAYTVSGLITDKDGGSSAYTAVLIVTSFTGPSADLALTFGNEVERGRIRLLVDESNLGPSASAGATVVVKAPRGVKLHTTQGGSCKSDVGPTGVTLTCVRPALASGASRRMVIVLIPPGSGTYTFNATLTGVTPDPNLTNNAGSTLAVKP